MANMRVVNTEWTGSCVIACDCGSEEPVEGTVHSVASGVLEDEIKRLRKRNRWLHGEWMEALDLIHVAGSSKLEEENESLREEVVRCHTTDDERRRVIRELRSQITTWKRLWQEERKKNRGEKFSPFVDQYYTNEDE
jgi:predicted RNase H-like nuclease (RuvC/YqgF family)